MIEIPDKVYLSTFNTEPKGDERYVIVVNDSDLQEKIIKGTSYTTMKIADTKDAVHYAELIKSSLDSGGYARDYTFLLASIDKGPKAAFIKELDNRNLRIDKSAYKIFYGKNDPVYCEPEEIAGFIAEYIGNNSSSDSAEKPKKADKCKIVCLQDIGTEQVEWLWFPYIPKGKLTIVQGDPGGGKTYSMLKVVAELSKGGELPGDTEKREPIKILYQTAEDGYEDTIKQRLEGMGANFKNIFMIDEGKTPLSFTDERIENFLKEHNPGLIVFDPLQEYLGAGVDMHRANEVRPVMAHLIKLAEKYKCALVVLAHMSKMTQSSALYRNLGSIDITAAARSVLVVGKDPEEPERRIIAQVKNSLEKHGASIAFKINGTTGVEWDGYSDLEADDILNSKRERKKRIDISLESAKLFLTDILDDKKYEKRKVIMEMAAEAGISERTLDRAKEALGIKSHCVGYGKNKLAWWCMKDVKKEDLPHEPEQVKISDLSVS